MEDSEAEYDSPSTLQAIREAIASWGHEVIDLEANQELPTVLAVTPLDLVFNIAEGFKGRNREAQVPSLLELLDIPYTGSDPATLSLALDKALAKKIVRQHGIHTPNFQIFTTGKERLNREFTEFPLMVKPVAEGSSKGVVSKSVVQNEAELRDVVREMVSKYQQPALVEEYIRGREFTVGLLGERRPRVLPPMEIVFVDKAEENPVYSFQHKLDWNDRIRYDVPANLEPNQIEKLRTAGRGAFMALGCRDVARIDFQMDARGRFYFLECNPLPGLTPGWSDLVLIAKGAGHGLPDADRGDPQRAPSAATRSASSAALRTCRLTPTGTAAPPPWWSCRAPSCARARGEPGDPGPGAEARALQRAHFQVMFGNHVDWTCKHPQLEETADTAFGVLISQVQACQAAGLIRSGDPLVPALFACSMVHGLWELIANGQFNALELSVPPVEQLMGMMNLMLIEGARPRE